MTASRRSRDGDLHGSAPDDCPIALLIIDAINDFDYEEADGVLAEARPMAMRIRRLTARARVADVPILYVNDNLGRWRSDFGKRGVAYCSREGARADASWFSTCIRRRRTTSCSSPSTRHSSPRLGLLLDHLGARTLILTGLLARHVRSLHGARRLHARLPHPRAG